MYEEKDIVVFDATLPELLTGRSPCECAADVGCGDDCTCGDDP